MENRFIVYLIVMAVVTYLIRVLPLLLVREKIENKFIVSFLYYLPSAVLSVMTVPAIFYATSSKLSAALGLATAVILSYFGKSLMKVAVISCIVVLVAEMIIKFV
ncbi:MAG: AzlD domain-containing protein [Firmicutes bacterium]|nr:AzlD domain-containing protein [Bacillota bacterium]